MEQQKGKPLNTTIAKALARIRSSQSKRQRLFQIIELYDGLVHEEQDVNIALSAFTESEIQTLKQSAEQIANISRTLLNLSAEAKDKGQYEGVEVKSGDNQLGDPDSDTQDLASQKAKQICSKIGSLVSNISSTFTILLVIIVNLVQQCQEIYEHLSRTLPGIDELLQTKMLIKNAQIVQACIVAQDSLHKWKGRLSQIFDKMETDLSTEFQDSINNIIIILVFLIVTIFLTMKGQILLQCLLKTFYKATNAFKREDTPTKPNKVEESIMNNRELSRIVLPSTN